MAQTAVEQLVNYIKENFHLTDEALIKFEKAKQIERWQIEIAYEKGQDDKSNVYFGNEYYNETYTTRLQNETN